MLKKHHQLSRPPLQLIQSRNMHRCRRQAFEHLFWADCHMHCKLSVVMFMFVYNALFCTPCAWKTDSQPHCFALAAVLSWPLLALAVHPVLYR